MISTYELMEGFVGTPSGPIEHTLLYACSCCVSLLLIWFVPYILLTVARLTHNLAE